jgi:hypothetical protein
MEMPTEQEMLPKDKYTVFDRKVKRYRKGIHSTCGTEVLVDRGSHGKLILSRGAEVDEGQPETQSSGFLDGCAGEYARTKCIISCHHTLCTDTAQVGRTIYTFKLHSVPCVVLFCAIGTHSDVEVTCELNCDYVMSWRRPFRCVHCHVKIDVPSIICANTNKFNTLPI